MLADEDFGSSSELSCRVHLRSLATGAPHPAGPKSGMIIHTLPAGHYAYTIQTSEDSLGLLISSLEDLAYELIIFNWNTGAVRLVRRKSHITRAMQCNVNHPLATAR